MAEELGFGVEIFAANWEKHGRGAGPIRNEQMLRDGKPAGVYAFPSRLDSAGKMTPGTQDMVTRALRAGVVVTIFPPAAAPSTSSG